MVNKTIRLGKAFWNESVKRLPYIIALLIIIGGVGALQSYRKTAESVRVGRDNSEQVKSLTLRIKKLTEENRDLNKQTRNQSFCFVKAFATYTQTLKPITLEQIIACNVTSSTPAKPGSLSVAAPQSQSKVFVSAPPPQSAPKTGNNQANAKPDNDGVIINLPLLPKIHIPSPL